MAWSMNSFIMCIVVGILMTVQISLADSIDDDMIAKSIVYDKKTPDVFYCPIDKHEGVDNMLVKAVPIHRLCEYQGGDKPKGYRRDCYNDVDESAFACKERKRIMKRAYPPGMEALEKYKEVPRTKRAEYYNVMMKETKTANKI